MRNDLRILVLFVVLLFSLNACDAAGNKEVEGNERLDSVVLVTQVRVAPGTSTVVKGPTSKLDELCRSGLKLLYSMQIGRVIEVSLDNRTSNQLTFTCKVSKVEGESIKSMNWPPLHVHVESPIDSSVSTGDLVFGLGQDLREWKKVEKSDAILVPQLFIPTGEVEFPRTNDIFEFQVEKVGESKRPPQSDGELRKRLASRALIPIERRPLLVIGNGGAPFQESAVDRKGIVVDLDRKQIWLTPSKKWLASNIGAINERHMDSLHLLAAGFVIRSFDLKGRLTESEPFSFFLGKGAGEFGPNFDLWVIQTLSATGLISIRCFSK